MVKYSFYVFENKKILIIKLAIWANNTNAGMNICTISCPYN